MDYSLRELECFIAVAEELSFTRAAKRLNLAQPPLSRHIRILEEKIGAVLFLREPRRISLTAAGSIFYDETRHIPRRLARAGEVAKRASTGETARLRLGFVSAVMNDGLVEVFRGFRERHPAVQIMLHDISPHEQLRAISDGRLDGGFIGLAPPAAEQTAGIRLVPWRKEALVCLVPKDHPLGDRKSISLAALAGESFISVSFDSAPAFATHVRELCKAAGFRPREILESPRAQAVALMVAAGSGIAILPAALAALVKSSATAIAIKGSPKITHVFACQRRRTPGPLEDLVRRLR
jgi:DNA-binding transcriptional LysR family regulator